MGLWWEGGRVGQVELQLFLGDSEHDLHCRASFPTQMRADFFSFSAEDHALCMLGKCSVTELHPSP